MAGETESVLGALFLGVTQGLTEFLPVSSSGHLVLFEQAFGLVSGEDEILFYLVLHVGTLIPVLYFYRDWVFKLLRDPFVGEAPFREREGVQWIGYLLLASVPTAIIGLAFEDLFETLFSTPATLAVTFTITALLLLATSRFDRSHLANPLSAGIVLTLGIAQGIAITPGISRSGTTIAVALLLGLDRETAARFSFLMSVPAITGALLLKLRDAEVGAIDPTQLVVGGSAALVTGYLALVLLVQVVRAGRMAYFAAYLFAVAGFALYLAVAG
ncbi:MAG: undecaprenyl-diphosphate phosphatase [Myxococcota bacterium]